MGGWTISGVARRWAVASAVAVVLVAAACSPGVPATPGDVSGIGQRTISLSLTGSQSYAVTEAPVTGGVVSVVYNGSNRAESVTGSATYPGVAGGAATATFNLTATGSSFNGSVSISDPSVGLTASVQHLLVAVSIDGDDDASATASAGGLTLSWAIDTESALGLEPTLDALAAGTDTYCQDAQQALAGLDPGEVTTGDIANVLHPDRTAFGASKAELDPLTVHSYTAPTTVTTASGNTVVIDRTVSCKTRSADHLATTGVATSAPVEGECRDLAQTSFDTAYAALTAGEQTDYDALGLSITHLADIQASTGSEWLSPSSIFTTGPSGITTQARSLLVRWTDPNYQLLSEEIRGVHYCTVIAPTAAYWWFTVGAFEV